MPCRLLREGILDSDAVNALSFPAEVFYRRLMSVVDDFGRFDARPAVLRSRLYPLLVDKVREADISRWIAECEKAGLIALYAAAGGHYLLFRKLGPPRAQESKYPPPPSDVAERAQTRAGENVCAQTRASVPYSDSYSDTSSNTSTEPPPTPPKRGGEMPAIPENLDTPEFREAWGEWVQHRKERKPKVTPTSAKLAFAQLAEWGPDRAVAAIRRSIAAGWQGIFESRQPAAGPNGAQPTFAERMEQYRRQKGKAT